MEGSTTRYPTTLATTNTTNVCHVLMFTCSRYEWRITSVWKGSRVNFHYFFFFPTVHEYYPPPPPVH